MIDTGGFRMRLVDRSEFFVVTADDGARIVRFERTSTPFTSLETVDHVYKGLLQLARSAEFSGFSLLIDARNGPGRNDDAFENVLTRYSGPLFGSFTRCALLLRTQVGVMQGQRLSRGQKAVEVFQDEAHALAYLRTGER